MRSWQILQSQIPFAADLTSSSLRLVLTRGPPGLAALMCAASAIDLARPDVVEYEVKRQQVGLEQNR